MIENPYQSPPSASGEAPRTKSGGTAAVVAEIGGQSLLWCGAFSLLAHGVVACFTDYLVFDPFLLAAVFLGSSVRRMSRRAAKWGLVICLIVVGHTIALAADHDLTLPATWLLQRHKPFLAVHVVVGAWSAITAMPLVWFLFSTHGIGASGPPPDHFRPMGPAADTAPLDTPGCDDD